MIELISAIALLCQVSSIDKGSILKDPYHFTDEKQLQCQQYYVHCIKVKENSNGVIEAIERCILERKAQ